MYIFICKIYLWFSCCLFVVCCDGSFGMRECAAPAECVDEDANDDCREKTARQMPIQRQTSACLLVICAHTSFVRCGKYEWKNNTKLSNLPRQTFRTGAQNIAYAEVVSPSRMPHGFHETIKNSPHPAPPSRDRFQARPNCRAANQSSTREHIMEIVVSLLLFRIFSLLPRIRPLRLFRIIFDRLWSPVLVGSSKTGQKWFRQFPIDPKGPNKLCGIN